MSIINLSRDNRKIIFLSSLGGALEFYDFIVYVFLASELSQLFFPKSNHLASLMGVYAVFALGYLVRPLGGIIFSHFGDTYGRKTTFVITLILMVLPTFLIGLLPTHETIGIGAPVLLILLRLMQGLSVGGEIPGAITFAAEHVSPKYRGLACAIIFFGINFGLVLGSGICVLLMMTYSHEQILSWAWRLPFLLGGILGIISIGLRKKLTETPVFKLSNHAVRPKFPIFELFRNYRLELFQGVALTWLDAVITCLLFLYLPTYLTSILHYSKETINIINTFALILSSILFVGLGWLSDHFGRRIFLLIGSFSFIFLGYAFFYLLALQQVSYVVIVMIAVSLLSACISGIYTCTIIELFPTTVRYTGMALSYNIGYAIFGGLTPLIATSLIDITGNILSPSFYLIISAIVCFLGALSLKNKQNIVPILH
ncbi:MULTISPECIES: MFS transporter [Legionella]|uniref:MFS transporter n=1 Tax=Legionella resiliens TaxID=2905958 RepID=A0ABS8WX02_9GAMM|nr:MULTISPECIES: MFS transporter [unclassified Legionella]MCE0721862.1 MFS transporter [Legionella sp. 9fVS26]MCE3531016.1 MFS transporter [Legionella sp. 8cVS16]QLZ70578.1 MFS transporter [Legionella sp. PC1000]